MTRLSNETQISLRESDSSLDSLGWVRNQLTTLFSDGQRRLIRLRECASCRVHVTLSSFIPALNTLVGHALWLFVFMDIFFAFTCYVNKKYNSIWAAPCENVSSCICGQRRPRSAQSDQGLHCPLTESLDTTESRAKARMILCALERWSESVHFKPVRWHIFTWRCIYQSDCCH